MIKQFLILACLLTSSGLFSSPIIETGKNSKGQSDSKPKDQSTDNNKTEKREYNGRGGAGCLGGKMDYYYRKMGYHYQ